MIEGKPGKVVLRIAQITDTHLYADPDDCLLGLNTAHCLAQVIELAARRKPQLLVLSGDLTHDASAPAYERLQSLVSRIDAPAYCLPGNHDEAERLHSLLNGNGCHSIPELVINGWQLVFLDSTVPGSEGGHLSEHMCRTLDTALCRHTDTPALVWLHHQPVPVGSRWLDTMAVDNPEDLFAVTDRHPQVRAIVWGHVHQVFDNERHGVRLLATPSTCIQFLPASETFAIDPVAPGYRWIDLHSDGSFETGVERLAAIPGRIDTSSRGY